MKKLITALLVLAAVAGVGLLVAGAEASEPAGELTRVEPIKVCMVNDALFEKDQIPVEVDGKTYYGCCQMCKGRLAEDATARQATDPVTGDAVDKALAVIAARPDGSVLYFASEETLARYRDGERAR